MGINNQLENLYSTWSQKYSSFIKGGVINEDYYADTQPKILYILKEVNSKDNHWSLVDLVNKQIEDRSFLDIWDTIALFSLFFTTGLHSYKVTKEKGKYLDKAGYCDALQSIAVTNIKKTCGGGQSNWNEILEYGICDKDLIQREIDIISPDFIICGGTFDILKEVFGLQPKECDTGAQYTLHNGKIYIDMPHPKIRVNKKVLFSYFRETMLELKEKKIINI